MKIEVMKKWSIVLFLLLLIGCEPKPKNSDLLKNYVVFTTTEATSFSQYSSYYLSMDTLVYVYNGDSVWQCVSCGGNNNLFGSYVHTITSEVNNNMSKGGFTKVEWNQNPDLEVFISIEEDYNEYYSYGGGGYYGGYYPTVSVSDQETLHIYLVDIKKETLIWEGDISDMIATLDDAQGSLMIEAIDKAFQQSPVTKK